MSETYNQEKIILLGNAGAGKTTMARYLMQTNSEIIHLSLDQIAWNEGAERKKLEQSTQQLKEFIDLNQQWIIEGCYGDLIEFALPYCTELRFLNPGIKVCVEHCQKRAWEPEKFASIEDQQAMLAVLIDWVKEYGTREDEYGLQRHRQIFTSFKGKKTEYTDALSYKK